MRKPIDRIEIDPVTGCHNWTGRPGQDGYGKLKRNGKYWRAHRWFYAQKNGPIPDGLLVCHSCDNRLCVNHEHLFLGTAKDNARDCIAKGRKPAMRGTKNGHAKLDELAVLHIRDCDWPYAELVSRFGVSPPTVCDIRTRRTWAWLG